MNYKGIGFVLGVIVGLILVVILFKYANTDKKIMTEYDERQEKVRGKGYMYAFYTALIVQAIMVIASVCQIEIPVEEYILHFAGILFGCMTLDIYCTWNNVYWGLNNNHRRYGLVFAIAIIINILAIAGPVMSGMLFEENGKIGLPALNIMVIFMMTVYGITYLVKKAVDAKKDTEEED